MKKNLAILFAALSLCCSFTACDGDDDDNNNNNNNNNPPTTTPSGNLLPAGQACDGDDKCASGWCKAGDGANAKSLCADLLGENAECTGNEKRCDSAKSLKCEASETDPAKKFCKKDQASGSQKAEVGGECTINAGCKDSWCKKANANDAKGVCAELLEDNVDCTDSAQCKNGYCNKVQGVENTKKCASTAPSGTKQIGEICTADGECESGFCTGTGVLKCAHTDCKLFMAYCGLEGGKQIAYKSCNPETGELVTEDCTGAKICKRVVGGVACGDDSDVAKCPAHESCDGSTNGGKDFCNNLGQCVAKADLNPCDGVDCSKGGVCFKGICVTKDMTQLKGDGTEPCDKNSFQSFCANEGKVYECADSKIVATQCDDPAVGAGKCVTAIGNSQIAVAFCSNDERAIQACNNKTKINVCYGKENWIAEVLCLVDSEGNDAAMYQRSIDDCSTKSATPVCGYGANGEAECKAN